MHSHSAGHRWFSLSGLFGLIALSSFAGCSLAVDTDALTLGDEGLDCSSSEKICPISLEDPEGPRECVSITSPQNGCSGSSCRPCEVPGAIARCSSNSGECTIASCEEGFLDCDGDESNGCEVNIAADEENCGSCGTVCALDNAVVSCIQSSCQFVVCVPQFGDCDGDDRNGCEVDLSTSSDHCGDCDSACEGTCVEGECEI